MARLRAKDFHTARLEQIEDDVKAEYRKGSRKDIKKIAMLLNEKEKINSILGGK